MDKVYIYIVYTDYIFVYIQCICIYGIYIVYMYIWNICIQWNTESESVSRSVVSDSFVTPWTVARQAPLSIEYWSGLPFPSPRDLPDPGTKPGSPEL